MDKELWVPKSKLLKILGKGDLEMGMFEWQRLGLTDRGSHGLVKVDLDELQTKLFPPLKVWHGHEGGLPHGVPSLRY